MNPIQIVGGGLAGLTLGIALRQTGAPVKVIEAGRYPRHRVCGEFISGQGRRVLRELGLEQKLIACGATEARTAAFYSSNGAAAVRELPQPALCLARYAMDDCLAQEFKRLGGNLAVNERWSEPFEAGIVRATGRRVAANPRPWRWFALKAHAREVALEADLEMHLLADAYVGLCRLPNDLVNVCGLFRSHKPLQDLAREWRRYLQGPPGATLHVRLRGAEFLEDSFCATAGLDLEPQCASAQTECCLGDAITMIAPLTGNGMSMAFESAELAAHPLLDYSRGRISWSQTSRLVSASCDRAFRRRLFWAFTLQRMAFRRLCRDAAVWAGAVSPFLWRQLFWRTR